MTPWLLCETAGCGFANVAATIKGKHAVASTYTCDRFELDRYDSFLLSILDFGTWLNQVG